MKQYLDIVKHVLDKGEWKSPVRRDNSGKWVPVDDGIRTLACPNVVFSHEMSEGFPLLTTKKMAWKTLKVELEGFINGITDKKWYQERGCKIWDEWANPELVNERLFKDFGTTNVDWEIKKRYQTELEDLGRLYGYVWRSFGTDEEIIRVEPKTTKYELASKEEVNITNLTKNVNKKELSELEYVIFKNWYDMLNRCYNENCTQYKWYGAKGKKVCKLWLNFYEYISSIKTLNNWVAKQRNPRDYALDKDYYCSDHYAPDVCVWLSNYDNKLYNSSQCVIISKANETHKVLNFTQAANIIGCTRRAVSMALSENRTCKGWDIKKVDGIWRKRLPTDQLYNIVDTLRNNPMDRRMVCSAWNPTILPQAALPSCHWGWNTTVIGNKLYMSWIQRSCDLMIGVPFNIASYALLHSLLALEANLEPGNLTGLLVDCHIYENQIPTAREQIKREPRKLPTLNIPDNVMKKNDVTHFDIFEWTHEDAYLIDYNPHPKIDMGKVTI